MSESRDESLRSIPMTSKSSFTPLIIIGPQISKSVVTNHIQRKEVVKGKADKPQKDFSFDEKCMSDFDTSALIKRRLENEAYLEEIERSIIDNIESTNTIIHKNTESISVPECRPLNKILSVKQEVCVSEAPSSEQQTSIDEKAIHVERSTSGEETKKSWISDEAPTRMSSFMCQKEKSHKNKLNYHKLNKKVANKSIKVSGCPEFTSISCFDFKEVKKNSPLTPTQQSRISSKRLQYNNKNKMFQEVIQGDEKEMIRAMSHVSFTNRTDMFDNYESHNSTMNEHSLGEWDSEVLFNQLNKDFEDGNIPLDLEDFGTNIWGSFVNLKTSKNKFYESKVSNEFNKDDRSAFDNFTNNSLFDMLNNKDCQQVRPIKTCIYYLEE